MNNHHAEIFHRHKLNPILSAEWIYEQYKMVVDTSMYNSPVKFTFRLSNIWKKK